MPVRGAEDLDDPTKKGKNEIPGLKDFLRSPDQRHKHRVSPVIIFEDVNINISDPNPGLTSEKQRDLWYK